MSLKGHSSLYKNVKIGVSFINPYYYRTILKNEQSLENFWLFNQKAALPLRDLVIFHSFAEMHAIESKMYFTFS